MLVVLALGEEHGSEVEQGRERLLCECVSGERHAARYRVLASGTVTTEGGLVIMTMAELWSAAGWETATTHIIGRGDVKVVFE